MSRKFFDRTISKQFSLKTGSCAVGTWGEGPGVFSQYTVDYVMCTSRVNSCADLS